jgi:type I restriction enzyme, S subunit
MNAEELFLKRPLGELLTLEYGVSLPEWARSGMQYLVFGSNGVVGEHSRFLVDGPGIIVGRKGSVGEVSWSAEPFWPIDTTYYVIPKHDNDLRWLYWVLVNTDLKRLDAATGVPGLNRKDVYGLYVHRPAEDDQSRIASVLDALDVAVAKTEAMIAKLQQIRAGLLQDLLTRGVDEDGNPRDPIAHPEQFQDSVLGQIPKEWELVTVEGAGEVRLGRQRSPAYERGQHMCPYLRVANVFDGFIDYSDILLMNFEPAEREIYGVAPGDVLLNEGQSLELVGRSAIFEGQSGEYCFQNTLVRFRCNETTIPEFCQAVFKSWLDRGGFTSVARQTTSVAHLGADRFAKMPFPRPKIDEQQRISMALQVPTKHQKAEELELAKLRHVKSGLAADLLTGRVRVPQLFASKAA